MNFNICPSCLAENDDDARVCVACGHALVDADTVPAAFETRAAEFLPGNLWLDDLRAGQRTPADLKLTLRELPMERTRPLPGRRERRPTLPTSPGFSLEAELPVLPELNEPIAHELPPLPELNEAIDLPAVPAGGPLARPSSPPPLSLLARDLPPSPPPPEPAPPPPPVELSPEAMAAREAMDAKRAARRASVRRSRLRALHHSSSDLVSEVLVVDRNDIDRGVLCGLLQAFGFVTHSLADPGLAVHLLQAHAFVAVFTDIALDASDGGDGIDLARAVKQMPQPGLLVLVSQPLSAIDRVRAELAGFDDVLAKPVTRGNVARVLDGHGIALPADARRT